MTILSRFEHDEPRYTFDGRYGGAHDAQTVVWILNDYLAESTLSQFMVELRQLHWVA